GVYVRSLQAQFAEPSRIQLERELTQVAMQTTRLTSEQYASSFERLRAYLEMGNADRIEPEWEASALTDVWARVLGVVSPIERAALAPHAEHYVNLVKSGEAPPWHTDTSLV